MTKLVRFDAAAHHRLLAFGAEIRGGQIVAMPDEHAAALAADPNVNVTVFNRAAAKRKPTPDENKEN